MKVEPRGKFGGIKAHLDASECTEITVWAKEMGLKGLPKLKSGQPIGLAYSHLLKLAKSIGKLQEEYPDLLIDKSPDQVKDVLLKEKTKAELKLAKMNGGTLWDPKEGIKVEV